MKNYIIAALLLVPLSCFAQNWETAPSKNTPIKTTTQPRKLTHAEKEAQRLEAEQPYLAGAVPMENGCIEYNVEIPSKGKSAQDVYDIAYRVMDELAHGEEQFASSKVALVNRDEKKLIATYDEWLVFTSKILELDRTQFSYIIEADCADELLTLKISRLRYVYEEHRAEGFRAAAEEIIADSIILSDDGTRLKKRNAKFRRKTVDRMKAVVDTFKAAMM